MKDIKQKILLKRTTEANKESIPSGASHGELFLNIASGANAHNKIATMQIGTNKPIVWSDDVANEKKFASKTEVEALVKEVEDNELVTATAISTMNTSAGFNEDGSSVLDGGVSLSEAIIELQEESKQHYAKEETLNASIEELETNIEDNERVFAAALVKFNESAGFSEDGSSTLEGGKTLTEAIIDIEENYLVNGVNEHVHVSVDRTDEDVFKYANIKMGEFEYVTESDQGSANGIGILFEDVTDSYSSGLIVEDGYVKLIGETEVCASQTGGGSIELFDETVQLTTWSHPCEDDSFVNKLTFNKDGLNVEIYVVDSDNKNFSVNKDGLIFDNSRVVTEQILDEHDELVKVDENGNVNKDEITIGSFEIKNDKPYNYTFNGEYRDYGVWKITAEYNHEGPKYKYFDMWGGSEGVWVYEFVVTEVECIEYTDNKTMEEGFIIDVYAGLLNEDYEAELAGYTATTINFNDDISDEVTWDFEGPEYMGTFIRTAPLSLRYTSKVLLNGSPVVTETSLDETIDNVDMHINEAFNEISEVKENYLKKVIYGEVESESSEITYDYDRFDISLRGGESVLSYCIEDRDAEGDKPYLTLDGKDIATHDYVKNIISGGIKFRGIHTELPWNGTLTFHNGDGGDFDEWKEENLQGFNKGDLIIIAPKHEDEFNEQYGGNPSADPSKEYILTEYETDDAFNYHWELLGETTVVDKRITDEINRAKDAESALTINLNKEIERAKEAESRLDTAIANNPIVKGGANNSAILKGEFEGYSNSAISQVSMAIGAASTAGLKGWYYSKIEFGTNPVITLSDKQPTGVFGALIGGAWSSGVPNITAGDKVSIVNDAKYDYCGEVKSVSGNKITLKSSLPFNSLNIDLITANNIDDWSIYLPDKEGAGVIDFGGGALAEGVNTKATNIGAHAEGIQTHAYGQYSHTEGFRTKAAYASHAEGRETIAAGQSAHAEGNKTLARGNASHTEGASSTNADELSSYTNDKIVSSWTIDQNILAALGKMSHAEGFNTLAVGDYSHTEGQRTTAKGTDAHAEGYNTAAIDNNAHAEGSSTIASGNASHAEGSETIANGNSSHSEGIETQTNGWASHAEGGYNVTDGEYSHIEGRGNYIGGNNNYSTEVVDTNTKAYCAHAEGQGTKATGNSAHAEGIETTADGLGSHAEGSSTKAIGEYSHAEGYNTVASGSCSHAEGSETFAAGQYAHAEGNKTLARGNASHTEGASSTNADELSSYTNDKIVSSWTIDQNILAALGKMSHAEGFNTLAVGDYSHTEGQRTTAKGTDAHAEGYNTAAIDNNAHAEGSSTIASGNASHAEGSETIAAGKRSHAEGYKTEAIKNNAHAEGNQSKASGNTSHAEGYMTIASGDYSHTEGYETVASGERSHAEGTHTKARGNYSHAEGSVTYASGTSSHAEGNGTLASGRYSHAEGYEAKARGEQSHAEGYKTVASGYTSHAEGWQTIASGDTSHAEGRETIASGEYSHAEGYETVASGERSHAEGYKTAASGRCSHAEGWQTKASGNSSHASGIGTVASGEAEFACGKYNKSNINTLFSIGNGTSSASTYNVFEVKTDNTVFINGKNISVDIDKNMRFMGVVNYNPLNDDFEDKFSIDYQNGDIVAYEKTSGSNDGSLNENIEYSFYLRISNRKWILIGGSSDEGLTSEVVSELMDIIEDNEFVTSTALNKINESAGFYANGSSRLPNGQSLTDAIIELKLMVDNSGGSSEGGSSNSIAATTGTGLYYLLGHSSTSSDAQSVYKNNGVYMENGNLYAASDKTLKTHIDIVNGDPELIKLIPKVHYHWNDDETKKTQMGTYAQDLEKVYPELVATGEDGIKAVAYDKLGVVALAGIDKLYEMVQQLQAKNEELEKRIKELENK